MEFISIRRTFNDKGEEYEHQTVIFFLSSKTFTNLFFFPKFIKVVDGVSQKEVCILLFLQVKTFKKSIYILIDSCWIQIEITMLTFVSDRVLVSVYAHDRKAQTITTHGLILAPRSKGQCDIFVYKI